MWYFKKILCWEQWGEKLCSNEMGFLFYSIYSIQSNAMWKDIQAQGNIVAITLLLVSNFWNTAVAVVVPTTGGKCLPQTYTIWMHQKEDKEQEAVTPCYRGWPRDTEWLHLPKVTMGISSSTRHWLTDLFIVPESISLRKDLSLWLFFLNMLCFLTGDET